MATTITSMEPVDRVEWEMPLRGSSSSSARSGSKVYPYPIPGGVRASYRQKCRDTVSGSWTEWETYYQDIYGNEYPGVGFDFSTFRVVGITYSREQ